MTEQKSNKVQQNLDEQSPLKTIDSKPNEQGERVHYTFCILCIAFVKFTVLICLMPSSK